MILPRDLYIYLFFFLQIIFSEMYKNDKIYFKSYYKQRRLQSPLFLFISWFRRDRGFQSSGSFFIYRFFVRFYKRYLRSTHRTEVPRGVLL